MRNQVKFIMAVSLLAVFLIIKILSADASAESADSADSNYPFEVPAGFFDAMKGMSLDAASERLLNDINKKINIKQ